MNSILEVFTKEYKRETAYRICMESNINKFKLLPDSYDVDRSINYLRNKEFISNFGLKAN